MWEVNIADAPSIPIPDLPLLEETMRRIEVPNVLRADSGLIELKHHVVLAIAERSVSTQQPYPVSPPRVIPSTGSEQGDRTRVTNLGYRPAF